MKEGAGVMTELASPRVRHLLASARKQFVERGFDAVSIDSIARTAGVSKETIYRHFPDKEALFRAALDEQAAAFTARAAAVHDSASNSGSELAGMARAILDSALDQGMFSVLWMATGVAQRMPDLASALQNGQALRLEPVRQALEDYAREKGAEGAVALELALDFGSLAVEGPIMLMGFPSMPPQMRDPVAHRAAALFAQGIASAMDDSLPLPPPLSLGDAEPCQEPPPHIRTLLDVAGRHFLTQGYEGANLHQISEEARVGRGTLYRHFTSKAGLFTGAMRALAQTCAQESNPGALPQGRTDVKALAVYLEAAVESLGSSTSIQLHRAVISQSRRDDALARHVYAALRAPWVGGLVPWLRSIGVRQGEDWYARQLVVLALRGNRMLAGGHPLTGQDRRRYAERAAVIFLSGYISLL
jgi:AcrR family transcriptional regulator